MAQPRRLSIAPHLRCIVMGLSLLVAATLRANDLLADLDDAVARAHYAWYAGDGRAVAHAVAAVMQTEVSDQHVPLKTYQTAVAYWRLADLKLSHSATDTRRSADQCVRHAREAFAQAPHITEALVVQMFCEDIAASTRASGKRRTCESESALQKAYSQAPTNPRVSWTLAWCADKAGDAASAVAHATRAITQFEEQALARSSHSDWGHAETCVLLARLLLAAGQRGGARDYVEQALVLMPDYVAAKQLLQQIAMP